MKKNLTHFYCKCVTTGSMKMGRTWLDLSLTYDSCAQWAVTSNEGKVECFRVSLLLSKVSNEKQKIFRCKNTMYRYEKDSIKSPSWCVNVFILFEVRFTQVHTLWKKCLLTLPLPFQPIGNFPFTSLEPKIFVLEKLNSS